MYKYISQVLSGLISFTAIINMVSSAYSAPSLNQTVILAPHRAVYDLGLLKTAREKQIEKADGRIALQFTGNVCEGFTFISRQLTFFSDGEGTQKQMDVRVRNWENGAGTGLKFQNIMRDKTKIMAQSEGKAERDLSGEVSVSLQRPRPIRLDLDGKALFPSAHVKELIESAMRGESFLSARVYDGSDDGAKLYDAVAVIGKEIFAGSDLRVSKIMRGAELEKLRRWPVSISYFEPGRGEQLPVYQMRYDLFENGITASLIMDFGNFSLTGALTHLELLPVKACAK